MVPAEDIRAIVEATLAAQQAVAPVDIEAIVEKAIATVLTSFGIEDSDRLELRADFSHLRRWRKSVESAEGLTVKVIIGTIVSGLLGLVLMGFHTFLGK